MYMPMHIRDMDMNTALLWTQAADQRFAASLRPSTGFMITGIACSCLPRVARAAELPAPPSIHSFL